MNINSWLLFILFIILKNIIFRFYNVKWLPYLF